MLEKIAEFWPWIIAIAMLLALLKLIATLASPSRLPYVRRERLVTKTELKFYRSLQKAVLDEFEVFAMVRIADVLAVEEGDLNYRKWLNKILGKHVDFVLCDPATLAPRLAIELDDRSHERPDRQERDAFVNRAFASAKLPLLRIPAADSYDVQALRASILEAA